MRSNSYTFLLVTFWLILSSCSTEEEQPKPNISTLSITGIELLHSSKDKSIKSSAQSTWKHVFQKSLNLAIKDTESGQVYLLELDPNDFGKTYSKELPYGTYSITSQPSLELYSYELPLLVQDRVTLSQSKQNMILKAESEFGLFTVFDQNIISTPATVSSPSKPLRKRDKFYYIYWKNDQNLTFEFNTSADHSFQQDWKTSAFDHRHLSIQKLPYSEEVSTFLETNFHISQSVIQINDLGVPVALSVNPIAELDLAQSETSGIAVIEGRLFSVNDGGNTNEVFELNPKTGQALRAVKITNATNVDWEELAVSDTYVYIGDFGNNSGKRKDLTIYRIAISELLGSKEAIAEKISFRFSDQKEFQAFPNDTNFDCEAMVFYAGSLHIFTKNWKNSKTKHYTLSPTIGNHIAKLEGDFDSEGLITGASITDKGKLVLLGYENKGITSRAFVWLFSNFGSNSFSSKQATRIWIGSPAQISQVEGIAFFSEGRLFIAGEKIKIGGYTVPALLSELNVTGQF